MDDILEFLRPYTSQVDEEQLKTGLVNLGVEIIDDLKEVNFETDLPELFKKVQARKIDKAVTSKFATPPLAAELPPSADATPPMQPRTPSSDPNSSSHSNFTPSISQILRNFKIPYNKFNPTTSKKFEQGKKATQTEINEIIRIIGGELWATSKYPGKAAIGKIAAELALKYAPTFEDTYHDGNVIGSGCMATERKLRNHLNNLNRSSSGLSTELFEDESACKKRRKSTKKDMYGCVNFLPDAFPEGETAESLRTMQQWLIAEQSKMPAARNEAEIQRCMSMTYILQRQCVADKDAVDAIKAQWPFLFEVSLVYSTNWCISQTTIILNFHNFRSVRA